MAVKSFGGETARSINDRTDAEQAAEQAMLRAKGLCIECCQPLRRDGTCSWNCEEED